KDLCPCEKWHRTARLAPKGFDEGNGKKEDMYQILSRVDYSDDVFMQVIEAPAVATACQAGQFIILMIHEEGERIPLTIADFDREAGTITIVVQAVGTSTRHLQTLGKGDSLTSFIGPLGQPSEIEKVGTVVCAAGGVGVAPIYPIARALKEAGNKVICIMAARNESLLFWEDKMREVSDELIVTTDDGSRGRKCLVTEPLKELCETGGIDLVYAIGPGIMMKFCAKTTEAYGIKTLVSLNSIMVDGTGMCGGCRVSVGGETKFVCVDGPEFDGHQVDFDLLMSRQRQYLKQEKASLDAYLSHATGPDATACNRAVTAVV
ncbi:MAG TPA: sulfide/dihydroorotate dehydrogenase-like FAD/NAD-binding protein, partial [Dermatophilaceae bacterium]